MPDHRTCDSGADTAPNAASDAASNTAPDTASHAAHIAADRADNHPMRHRTSRPDASSGSIQLCRGSLGHLGAGQAAVVLCQPSHLQRSANLAPATRRPVQLRRRLFELEFGLVNWQEGMVLQGPWQGLPWPGQRLRHAGDNFSALRL